MHSHNYLVILLCAAVLTTLGAGWSYADDNTSSNPSYQLKLMQEAKDQQQTISAESPELEEQRVIQRSYNNRSMRYDPGSKQEMARSKAFQRVFTNLPIFGDNLFKGNFSSTYYDEINPRYTIKSGDRLDVHIWGELSFSQQLIVDNQGNVFIPGVGPIKVSGVKNSQLTSSLKRAIRSVYARNYDIYVNLMTPQPMALFVTGFINYPGRYAGGETESLLYFIDQAGGIDAKNGSYRSVSILRRGKVIAEADLYSFLLTGDLPFPTLLDGDTILVNEKGISIAAAGNVRHKAWFEAPTETISGRELCRYAMPDPGVTHVSIEGFRDGKPFLSFLPMEDFQNFTLHDKDMVEFIADEPSNSIAVSAEGALDGNSRFMVKKGTTLREVLNYISVDPNYANLDGIHLRRKTVADRQRQALHEALHRLEQYAYTATSGSVDEANIRVKEAELISRFVEKAKKAEPQGVVVVAGKNGIQDVLLEDQDIIVIPPKSDIILVAGEVVSPSAIVFQEGLRAKDYIQQAGGFTDKADKSNVLVAKPDGELINAKKTTIGPGDQLLILPYYETKTLQVVKDISQIFYQMALAAKVVVSPWSW